MDGISVALATYNGALFIEEQLRSLAEQTLLPAELVVGDDRSSDDTLAIVERFAKSSPFPVRVLPALDHQLGAGANFLRTGSSCHFPVVAFCDQDDVWLPQKLQVCFERMTEDESVVVLHRSTITDHSLTPVGVLRQGIHRDARIEALTLNPYVTGWGNTMVFQSRLLRLVPAEERPQHPNDGGRARLLSHDTWIYTLGAALGAVSHVDQSLCLYRQHGENVTGAGTETRLKKFDGMLRAPVARYRDRVEFYRKMSGIFLQVAEASKRDHDQAVLASGVYLKRAARYAARVEIYETGIFRRLQLWLGILGIMCGDGRTFEREEVLSLMKDLALGVLRIRTRS